MTNCPVCGKVIENELATNCSSCGQRLRKPGAKENAALLSVIGYMLVVGAILWLAPGIRGGGLNRGALPHGSIIGVLALFVTGSALIFTGWVIKKRASKK